jgi:hypothetical protein
MIENIEGYMSSLPNNVLQNYCQLEGVRECQKLTHQCQSGEPLGFLSCLFIPIPCAIAAAQIGAPALDELINSSVKCY